MEFNHKYVEKENRLIFEKGALMEYELIQEKLFSTLMKNKATKLISGTYEDFIKFERKIIVSVDNETFQKARFVDLIWNQYSNSVDDYPLLEHELLRIREMLLDYGNFSRASNNQQFEICCKVYLMINHSLRKHMNENMPISIPKDEIFKYAPSEFYKKPKIIEL